jgi:Tfp pilus assembly protein PilN
MINLLPPDLKQDYRYARHNRRLMHWIAAFVLAIVGAAVITGGGLYIMNNSINDYKSRITTTKAQLAADNLTSTQAQVSTISNNLKLMVKVLSKEILFSKLLTQLGTLTPSNAELTGLTISQAQSAIEITAQTTNYNAATQLQANLASPNNQIFSNADIVSITCANGTEATNVNYPCTADIRAQFTSNNPFLFINANGKTAAAK